MRWKRLINSGKKMWIHGPEKEFYSYLEHRMRFSLILALLSLVKMQMNSQPLISTAQLKCCNMQRGIFKVPEIQ